MSDKQKLIKRLKKIYDHNVTDQFNRYTILINLFHSTFPRHKKHHIFRAPGRVNLIGEHT
ncbi:MAG: galactokinase family protein, partial [Planctomycetes bacterium]|nr:galactokinase family protein [Planctomycetota bacterium]